MNTVRSARGTLALIGGQEFSASLRDLDRELAAAAGADTVHVLGTAAAFEDPETVIARAHAHFDAIGLRVVEVPAYTRRDADDDGIIKRVKGAKFVYLADGSPMHLRSALKDTSLLAVLLGAYRNGASLAASGAGATVLCDPMVDPRGGAYTVGFGVVANLAVFPHHTNAANHLWQRSVELLPHNATLAGIDDGCALVRDAAGAWTVAGSGAVTFLGGGLAKPKKVKPGAVELPVLV